MIGVYHTCPLGMFIRDALKVINRKERDIEPTHLIEELEYGHVERSGVQCNPLYPFAGEDTAEQKILEQSGAKVTSHA